MALHNHTPKQRKAIKKRKSHTTKGITGKSKESNKRLPKRPAAGKSSNFKLERTETTGRNRAGDSRSSTTRRSRIRKIAKKLGTKAVKAGGRNIMGISAPALAIIEKRRKAEAAARRRAAGVKDAQYIKQGNNINTQQEGQAAKNLLAHPIVKITLDEIEEQLHLLWASSTEANDRDELWYTLKGLERFKNLLDSKVQNASLEEQSDA